MQSIHIVYYVVQHVWLQIHVIPNIDDNSSPMNIGMSWFHMQTWRPTHLHRKKEMNALSTKKAVVTSSATTCGSKRFWLVIGDWLPTHWPSKLLFSPSCTKHGCWLPHACSTIAHIDVTTCMQKGYQPMYTCMWYPRPNTLYKKLITPPTSHGFPQPPSSQIVNIGSVTTTDSWQPCL